MQGALDARSHPSDVRPQRSRVSRTKKQLWGGVVAPHFEAAPRRGRSLLLTCGNPLTSSPLGSQQVVKIPSNHADAVATSPTRSLARGRASSTSKAHYSLGTLCGLAALGQVDDVHTNSPRTDSRNSPRRGSYVLKAQPRCPGQPGHRIIKSTSLKHFRDSTSTLPKLPGTIEGSPEKIKALGGVASPQPVKQSFIVSIPVKPEQHSSQLAETTAFFGYSLAPLYDFWERLQVSHCGQYSVERMLALDEYCQRASILRVLAVCLLFPLGPLVVVILTECMPLQPVEKGPFANYVFWVRHTLMGTLLVVCAMVQAKSWIPGISMTMMQVFQVAIGSALMYTTACITIADFWVFPIPFLVVAGAPLMFVIWAVATRIVLGPRPLRGVQDGEFLGRRFLLITSVHASLLVIYPSYQAVFLALDTWMQLALVALLPAINLAVKNLQTALGSHLQDNLPEVIIFSVDVFSAIYSVLCMHSANSMKMVGLTLVLNTAVMLLSLHGMNRRSKVARACRMYQFMERQQQKLRRRQSVLGSVASAGGSPALLTTLVNTTVKLLQTPDQLNAAELQTIRLLSGLPHKLLATNVKLLDDLSTRCLYNTSRRSTETIPVAEMKDKYSSNSIEGHIISHSYVSTTSKPAQRLRVVLWVARAARRLVLRPETHETTTLDLRLEHYDNSSKSTNSGESESERFTRQSSNLSSHASTVVPESTVAQALAEVCSPTLPASNSVVKNELETQKQNTRAVKQTLQLLFNNEYLGLIAYTQCIIPLVYLLYMPVLQALPNHIYYPSHYRYFGEHNEFSERMKVIGILAALQLVVLVVLQAFVVKRFGISTIYQVAFVLESRFALSQCRLLMWLIFAVQSTLVHYGVDFSFHFAWLHKSSAGGSTARG